MKLRDLVCELERERKRSLLLFSLSTAVFAALCALVVALDAMVQGFDVWRVALGVSLSTAVYLVFSVPLLLLYPHREVLEFRNLRLECVWGIRELRSGAYEICAPAHRIIISGDTEVGRSSRDRITLRAFLALVSDKLRKVYVAHRAP